MKNVRVPAAAAAIALGISASIAFALPAAAADSYVVDGDIAVEGASYPNQWFTGNPQPTTAPVFTEDGLDITGQTQLLYGTNASDLDGATFLDLIAGAAVDASGTWTFQVPVFLDGANGTGFTTFRPATAGDIDVASWITSQAVGGYSANEVITSGQIADLLDGAADPVLLAYGIFVNPGDTATLASITWNGNTAFFVPEPVVVDPTPTPEPSVSGEPTPEPSVSGEPTPEPSVSGEPTPTPEPSVSAEPTPVAPPATAIAGDADFAG